MVFLKNRSRFLRLSMTFKVWHCWLFICLHLLQRLNPDFQYMLCMSATADTSGASLSEAQQQLFKRCHLACPNTNHSWPSAYSPSSSPVPLGCLDESMIIRAFTPINLFMLHSPASCSTPQSALSVCACLRPQLGIQQLKGRRKKSCRFIWFTISIQG